MQKTRNSVKLGILVVGITLLGTNAFAQSAEITEARTFAEDTVHPQSLNPDSVYKVNLNTLISAKKYKEAEKLVEKQMSLEPQNQLLHIDLGVVYTREKKDKKAKEQFDGVLQLINGDEILTQRIVKAFSDGGRDDYAILAYQRAAVVIGNPYVYIDPISKLYVKSGHLEEAIDALLGNNAAQYINVEGAKNLLLEIVGNDSEKLQQTQKILIKKINEIPDNIYYAELLTWIYTQKNDWDGALIQIEAIDVRNQETGKRLVDFARAAAKAKQYEAAGKAYDDVIDKGADKPFYTTAKSEKLFAAFTQLKNTPDYKPEEVTKLANLYDSLLTEFPQLYSTQAAADYAAVEAQYNNDVPRAIEILQTAIDKPDTRKNMAADFKLQMGDYYLLIGRIWDASLTYSQVDKDFKQDVQGEDARFRNAKLAYYRGDFDWAQRQLSILKASTSELIANDALYLSVLITENVEDSNFVPLQRFAYADLLIFQNKDKEAEALLDSINLAFPKHPLNDDIIMQRARLAEKHHDYLKAIDYLKTIYEKYSQDVLGDDAVFKMAEIYQNNLNKPEEAKHYYEQLIIDYPGSTFVQTARQRLAELNKATPNP